MNNQELTSSLSLRRDIHQSLPASPQYGVYDGHRLCLPGRLERNLEAGPAVFHSLCGRSGRFTVPDQPIFFDYLTESERMELMADEEGGTLSAKMAFAGPGSQSSGGVDRRFHVQPNPYDVLRDEAVEQ